MDDSIGREICVRGGLQGIPFDAIVIAVTTADLRNAILKLEINSNLLCSTSVTLAFI